MICGEREEVWASERGEGGGVSNANVIARRDGIATHARTVLSADAAQIVDSSWRDQLIDVIGPRCHVKFASAASLQGGKEGMGREEEARFVCERTRRIPTAPARASALNSRLLKFSQIPNLKRAIIRARDEEVRDEAVPREHVHVTLMRLDGDHRVRGLSHVPNPDVSVGAA